MTVLQAEEARDAQPAAAEQRERPYETAASKAALRARLKARHEVALRG